jgi:hypothetical protein
MSPYRGSDDQLEREISAVQRLVHVRLRRATSDLRELEATLAELRRELKRRRIPAPVADAEPTPEVASS